VAAFTLLGGNRCAGCVFEGDETHPGLVKELGTEL